MKNINNILRRANITPLERVTLLVHDDVQKEKTNKHMLLDSDRHSLINAWNPSVSEVKEYNRYINIVQLEDFMKMDAQMFLYRSELSLLRNHRLLDGLISVVRRMKTITQQSFTKDIPIEKSINFLTQNTCLRYSKILHIFTFHNLPKEIQDDLLLLDGEITNCEKYMDDQVFLYERFGDSDILSQKDKELIVNRIYSRMYYEGVKKIKNSTAEKDGFLLNTFFGELPIKDLFKKILADEYGASDKNEGNNEDNILSTITEYAKIKNVTIERLIKEKLFWWLDNGLFTKEYSPIFMSEYFDTWSGDTKKNHTELFIIWYEELQRSKQYFNSLFDSKKLNKKIIEKDFLGTARPIEIITGDSLYNCKENVDFVKEYQKQIETLLPISSIFLFIEKNTTPIINYQTLCEFKKLAQNVSTLFDVDMSDRYIEFANLYVEEVNLLNLSLSRLIDMATEYLYIEESLRYIVDINEDNFMFNFEIDYKGKVVDIAQTYSDEFKKLGI